MRLIYDINFEKIDNDWIIFFGIWLAEGWACKDRIYIAAHKPRVRKVLEPIIEKWGYHICKRSDHSNTNFNWSFGDVQLANYMKQFSVGSLNKFFPQWVWELNKEQSRLFIDSMMLGDGYINKSNAHMYFTSSEKMAEDLCRLTIHAGWSAHKRLFDTKIAGSESIMKDGRIIRSNGNNYTITIIKTKLEPEINHGHKKSQNGQKEEWIEHKGTVHCLTVSSGVFLVSENGKPVWTGNSRH